MHYNLKGLKLPKKLADVKDFLKEMGLNGKPSVDKLTIKKNDLASKEMEVILFKQ